MHTVQIVHCYGRGHFHLVGGNQAGVNKLLAQQPILLNRKRMFSRQTQFKYICVKYFHRQPSGTILLENRLLITLQAKKSCPRPDK